MQKGRAVPAPETHRPRRRLRWRLRQVRACRARCGL